MDIWTPVLPPVESYLLNTTKVKNDYNAFHTFFFQVNICKEPKHNEKVGFKKNNPREYYVRKVDEQINVDK